MKAADCTSPRSIHSPVCTYFPQEGPSRRRGQTPLNNLSLRKCAKTAVLLPMVITCTSLRLNALHYFLPPCLSGVLRGIITYFTVIKCGNYQNYYGTKDIAGSSTLSRPYDVAAISLYEFQRSALTLCNTAALAVRTHVWALRLSALFM